MSSFTDLANACSKQPIKSWVYLVGCSSKVPICSIAWNLLELYIGFNSHKCFLVLTMLYLFTKRARLSMRPRVLKLIYTLCSLVRHSFGYTLRPRVNGYGIALSYHFRHPVALSRELECLGARNIVDLKNTCSIFKLWCEANLLSGISLGPFFFSFQIDKNKLQDFCHSKLRLNIF